jgi:flagellar motor switch protein FliG
MPKQPSEQIDPVKKVAILVSTLDHRVADALLERLPEDQAARVRNAAMNLAEIPQADRERIAQEFMGTGQFSVPEGPAGAHDDPGVELDDSLLQKLASPTTYSAETAIRQEREVPPFRFLHEATTDAIAKQLQYENPQVIAVVVAHLPPRQAADVLTCFDPQAQADILRRVSELDPTDADVLRDVEKHLKLLLADEIRAEQNRAAGLSAVASILEAAGDNHPGLVTSLAEHDRGLASMLKRDTTEPPIVQPPREPQKVPATADRSPSKPRLSRKARRIRASKPVDKPQAPEPAIDPTPISFDELSLLNDEDLAKVFRGADAKLTLLALAGASPSFVERLLGQMESDESNSLRRRMEEMGPMRLGDIEHAQRNLAEMAGRLAARGEIRTPEVKRFAGAA